MKSLAVSMNKPVSIIMALVLALFALVLSPGMGGASPTDLGVKPDTLELGNQRTLSPSCTLTFGYWKTHSKYGPAPYDDNWVNVTPNGEDSPFFDTGETWYEVLWTSPKRGNAYFILAHQYIATYLNESNGASAPPEVDIALGHAADLLGQYDGAPDGMHKIEGPVREDFISTAELLDRYNNGDIGPGHCDSVPDSRIAFRSYRDGNWEIYIMNADGTGQRRLTNNLAADSWPACSPDGGSIAFQTTRDGNHEIYVMNVDGTNRRNLTNDPTGDTVPAWSPDGGSIAFRSDRDGNWEIYVMNVDGTDQRNLTNNPAADNLPAWSPGGNSIAFASDRDGNWEIYVMDADGTNQRNLTNNPAYDTFPSWSPDEGAVAFQTNRNGNWEIYVMNADGSNQRNLTNYPAHDDLPAWGP